MNPPFRPAVQLLTASLLLASVVTRSAAAQYYHYKALDFDISITQDGSLRSTERKFNRVVARLIDEPFELTVLSAGDAALRICASSTDRIFLTTRPGELIHSLPCFAEAEHAQFGDAIDGWMLPVGTGETHLELEKGRSLGIGDSRITRFRDFEWTGKPDQATVHVALVIDRNNNGLVDEDEYAFVDLEVESDHSSDPGPPLTTQECRTLLGAEADRVETRLRELSKDYESALGDHFSKEQFAGNGDAARETRSVFALLARDQFEGKFAEIRLTPENMRRSASAPNPRCGTAANLREASDVAIDTWQQLWEATLDLAAATVKGWNKVYGRLSQ